MFLISFSRCWSWFLIISFWSLPLFKTSWNGNGCWHFSGTRHLQGRNCQRLCRQRTRIPSASVRTLLSWQDSWLSSYWWSPLQFRFHRFSRWREFERCMKRCLVLPVLTLDHYQDWSLLCTKQLPLTNISIHIILMDMTISSTFLRVHLQELFL
jgi:hypothetical protein